MIDIQRIRDDLEGAKQALARKRVEPSEVDRLAEVDRRWRDATNKADSNRAQVKELSRQVGTANREGDKAKAGDLAEQSRALGEQQKQLDADVDRLAAERHDLLLRIPNFPSDDALDGAGEDDNRVVRVEQYDPDSYQPHQRVPHWEIGAELGILDVERATKISGSM